MKALGAEILAFWHEWPPGDDWCYDDYEGTALSDDEGEDVLDPMERYDLRDFAVITWQGQGGPPSTAPMRGEDYVEFQRWFSFWRKARTVVNFGVEVPKEQADAFAALMAEHGWKTTK